MADRPQNWNQNISDEFRANDGTVTTAGFGRALVLLHHVGARTGQERVSPAMGIRQDPDTWLVAASKAGAPDNPAWFHNLQAHPEVSIEVPGEGTYRSVRACSRAPSVTPRGRGSPRPARAFVSTRSARPAASRSSPCTAASPEPRVPSGAGSGCRPTRRR